MKKIIILAFVLCCISFGSVLANESESASWSGVDESVVEKFAVQAGRPPRDPYINTDQGDLLLFVFLLAGACGGFVAGYYFRMLFSRKPETSMS